MGLYGGRTRTRTWDPLIKSQLLYQLSYAPGIRPRRLCGRGPVAKRVPTVQGRPKTRRRAGGFRWRGAQAHSAACRAPRAYNSVPWRRTSQVYAHFTPAHRSSTKGKPPGGDPAAPVRRRSCRGAGSATAGARLGYMVTTGVVRQGVPCPACPYRIGAGPSGAFRRRRVLHGRGTRRGPARPSD